MLMRKRKEEIEKIGVQISKASKEGGLEVNENKTKYMKYIGIKTGKNKAKQEVFIDKTYRSKPIQLFGSDICILAGKEFKTQGKTENGENSGHCKMS